LFVTLKNKFLSEAQKKSVSFLRRRVVGSLGQEALQNVNQCTLAKQDEQETILTLSLLKFH